MNGDFFGGAWMPLTFPAEAKDKECVGFGFSFKGDKSHPDKAFVSVQTADGATYRTKNMRDLFATDQVQEVLLKTGDFELDWEYAKKNPEKAKALTGGPNWATVNRVDFSAVGALPNEAYVARIGRIFFAFAAAGAAQTNSDRGAGIHRRTRQLARMAMCEWEAGSRRVPLIASRYPRRSPRRC